MELYSRCEQVVAAQDLGLYRQLHTQTNEEELQDNIIVLLEYC